MIVQVRGVDPERGRQALERLLSGYWKPVYWVILNGWRKSREDAKDLTQEFFSTMILDKGIVDRFTPERGSFRSFLKGAVTNFMRDTNKAANRQKRGGGERVLSIDFGDVNAAELVPDSRSMSPDQAFHLAWKHEVFSRAADLVERGLKDQGKAVYYEVFRRYDLQPEGADVSYPSIGRDLGLTPDTVKNYLTFAREEFRATVNRVLSDTVLDSEALSAEVDALLA